MYITKMYEYEINGIVEVSNNVPENATLIKELNILNAEEGYYLERISDKIHFRNVWLREGDSQENYIEVIIENEDELDHE